MKDWALPSIKYPLLVNQMIHESQVKKVLMVGVAASTSHSPIPFKHSGSLLPTFMSQRTLSLTLSRPRGSTPGSHLPARDLWHPKNYRTEFLCFELAQFNCAYNIIIGRLGLAKFMSVPHYSYKVLKLSGH